MKRVALALLLVLAALIVGCDSSFKAPAFQLTDVTGAEFARDFQLTDHNGKPRTLADFKGKVVVVFFGYTHCPDVCPTTMSELALVMKELGKDADRLQVLFITVDPERDTPAVLSQYVPAFHPDFLGLYGDADATARTAKEFKVIYQKQALAGRRLLDGPFRRHVHFRPGGPAAAVCPIRAGRTGALLLALQAGTSDTARAK